MLRQDFRCGPDWRDVINERPHKREHNGDVILLGLSRDDVPGIILQEVVDVVVVHLHVRDEDGVHKVGIDTFDLGVIRKTPGQVGVGQVTPLSKLFTRCLPVAYHFGLNKKLE